MVGFKTFKNMAALTGHLNVDSPVTHTMPFKSVYCSYLMDLTMLLRNHECVRLVMEIKGSSDRISADILSIILIFAVVSAHIQVF